LASREPVVGSRFQIFFSATACVPRPPDKVTDWSESDGDAWFETAGGAEFAGAAAVSMATHGNTNSLRIILLPFWSVSNHCYADVIH
jgi:hypothetical protein